MRLPVRFIFLSFSAFLLFLSFDSAYSKGKGIASYQYYSPKPNSFGINPATTIIIRYGKAIDTSTLGYDWLQVTGKISGNHTGKFILNKDQLTLIFEPDKCFALGEEVIVYFREGIKTTTGEILSAFSYRFTIRQKPYEYLSFDFSDGFMTPGYNKNSANKSNSNKGHPISFNDIPEPLIYYSNGATLENIMTVLETPTDNYLYLFNNSGTLLLAKKTPHRTTNFKPHFSTLATYFDHTLKGHVKIDPFLNNVDTLFMKNGYKADAHDILLLENGHIIMESYDPQLIDMSSVVAGGDPNATVIGLIIQELDQDKNLLFEWRSWDHFKITDTYNNMLASVVEYVHCNSLDADSDTTLIFSSRNMNEITKINRLTGEIIWRLGGKNNEFIFENDTRGFSAQHAAMKQKNGNLTLFDNGNGLEPIYSRGIEYKIDELNKTAILVNEYRHDPDVFAYVTGNLQRLNNGNTFIFWGSILSQSGHIISEFDPTGKLAFEVRFDPVTYPTYNSYRTKWDHDIFELSHDSINFGEVIQGDSIYKDINVTNLTDKTVNITSVYGHNRGFKVKDMPLSLDALSTKKLTIGFNPKSSGSVSDILTICQETDSAIVARQLIVYGKSMIKTEIQKETTPDFEIFPNPVGRLLEIKSLKMISSILIYDLNGRNIKAISNPGNSFVINMESVDQGFYIVEVIFSDKTRSIKRIVK